MLSNRDWESERKSSAYCNPSSTIDLPITNPPNYTIAAARRLNSIANKMVEVGHITCHTIKLASKASIGQTSPKLIISPSPKIALMMNNHRTVFSIHPVVKTKAIKRAEELGHQIAEMTQERDPFDSREGRLLWYDRLPYLGEDRVGERRLLAAITSEAIPDERKPDIDGNLARADILVASGRSLDAMTEISKIINSCSELLSE